MHPKNKTPTQRILLVLLIILIALTIIFTEQPAPSKPKSIEPPKIDSVIVDTIPIDSWEIFRQALIQVESENNVNARNETTGAYGLYQHLPKGGYICEYNRLTKDSVSVDDLANNAELQHLIFDVVQEHHNPKKVLKKALIVHNSRGMSPNYMTTYEYRAMYWYYKLRGETLEKLINNNNEHTKIKNHTIKLY